jgi:hypothetical protein
MGLGGGLKLSSSLFLCSRYPPDINREQETGEESLVHAILILYVVTQYKYTNARTTVLLRMVDHLIIEQTFFITEEILAITCIHLLDFVTIS